jgi:hypothetical protein
MSKNTDTFGDVLPVPTSGVEALKKFLDELKESLPIHLEYAAIRAQMNIELFKRHVEAGFTEAQAMEIVKIKGI